MYIQKIYVSGNGKVEGKQYKKQSEKLDRNRSQKQCGEKENAIVLTF